MKNKYLFSIICSAIFFILFFFINDNSSDKINNQSSVDLSSLISKTKTEIKTGDKIQIQIQNGCGLSGIAKVYTKFLRTSGYDVLEYTNANHFNFENTQLIVHKKDTVGFVNEMVQILKIKPDFITYNYNNNFIYEMTVIIGHDYNNLDSYNEVTMHYEPF